MLQRPLLGLTILPPAQTHDHNKQMQRLLMQSIADERAESDPRLMVFANMEEQPKFGILHFTVDGDIIADGLLKKCGPEVPSFHWNRTAADPLSVPNAVPLSQHGHRVQTSLATLTGYIGIAPWKKTRLGKNKKRKTATTREMKRTATFCV